MFRPTSIPVLLSLALIASPALGNPVVSWPDLSRPAPLTHAGPDDVALIVAVERYSSVPAVPGAIQNATDWYTYFTRTLGLPSSQVTMLRDSEATIERIRRFASVSAGRAKAGSTLWFIFIGHGAPSLDGKDGLLVGFDAQQDAESLMARSLRRNELLELLADGPQARTIALLDACFSGRTQTGGSLVPGLQPLIPQMHVDPPGQSKGALVVLSAAAADQFAGPLPSTNRPAFSYLALGAVRGWADKNDDQTVTAEETRDFVQDTLLVHVRDRTQTPQLTTSTPDVVLAKGVSEKMPGSEPVFAEPTREPVRNKSQRLEQRLPTESPHRAAAVKAARAAGILDPVKLTRIADSYAVQTADLRTSGANFFYTVGPATLTENEFARRHREVTRTDAISHAEGRRNWGMVGVSGAALAASAAGLYWGITNFSRACTASDVDYWGIDDEFTKPVMGCDPFFSGGKGTGSVIGTGPDGTAELYDGNARVYNPLAVGVSVITGIATVISGAALAISFTQGDGQVGDNRLRMGDAQRAVDQHNEAILRDLIRDAGGLVSPVETTQAPSTPGWKMEALVAPTSVGLRVTF